MPYAAAHYQELQPQQLFDCRLVSEHIESLFQNTLKRLDCMMHKSHGRETADQDVQMKVI